MNTSMRTGLLLFCCLICSAYASKEITEILDQAKELTVAEVNALRPLFDEMQTQYDYIVSEAVQNGDTVDPAVAELYESLQHEFAHYFTGLSEKPKPSVKYDTHLPTVEELIGTPNETLSQEQLDEFLDMKSILQEVLDEAQQHIDGVVQRALQREASVLEINKIKIVQYVYKALTVLFHASVRVSRAAYCTYSHIPQLNESLLHLHDGVDCYTYTRNLIAQLEKETVATIREIKQNVRELADIYKKVAAKNSLLGKIMAIAMNVSQILKDIRNIYEVSMAAKDDIENKLPSAVQETAKCGTDFAEKLPKITETVRSVTSCILFVDDTTKDYDFLKPQEPDSLDWNDLDFDDES